MTRTVAALASTVLFLSCINPADADQRFHATLVSSQEVPSTSSAARGIGTVLLNTAETQIAVTLSFSGLTGNPIAAHIHGAAGAGANAGILFDFSGALPAATSGNIGTQMFAIDATQVMQLKSGQFYFNIHTSMFGGGEIRGQILTAPAQGFTATLVGSEQVPPAASAGRGSGTVLLNAAETHITIRLAFSGLTGNAAAAHIHGPAGPGTNAGIQFDFSGALPAAASGSVSDQVFAMTGAQVAQLKAGELYFNVHTGMFPDGEIRGQILLAPTRKFGGTLVAWQEVPPAASGATGTGTVLLSAAEDRIAVNLSFSGLTGAATAAHIHAPADAGSNAGILFDLSSTLPASTSGSIVEQSFAMTPMQVSQLKEGQFYFNVHTGNFPGGEVRAQILDVPVQKFSTTLTQSQEVPPTGSAATGAGTVLLNPTEDQMTGTLTFAGLSTAANAVHIHGPAPSGMNAGIVFPFDAVPAATSGLVPEQTFAISPAQAADLENGLDYFNVHSVMFGSGEIRGQLLPLPRLTVTKAGNGTSNGTVTSSPAGITCGGDCAEAYDSGTMVTLTAGAPASGSFFAGWSGACTGVDPCVLTLTGNATVNATYSASAFSFTDDPLSVGSTAVRAVHVAELRAAINTLRSSNGLMALTFTDTLLAGTTPIRAIHIAELRTALGEVYDRLKRPPPMYTDSPISAGTAVIRAHVAELRSAVRALE